MPRYDGIRSEPGRDRQRERKCDAGAFGVIPKILEENGAPSGVLDVPGGNDSAIMELRGRARPRMPENKGANASFSTLSAAAGLEFRIGVISIKCLHSPSA